MSGLGNAVWWVACGVALGIAIAVGFSGLPAEWLTPSGLVGENGSLGILLGTFTVLGAAITAVGVILNNRRSIESLDLTRRAELAGRFQRAAEMLAESDTIKVAGIQVLAEVARESDSYHRPVLRTLRQLLVELGRGGQEQLSSRLSARVFNSDPKPTESSFAPSGLATAGAIGAIARTMPKARWQGLADRYDRLPIREVYLFRAQIENADLDGVLFEDLVIGYTTFVGCSFRRSALLGSLIGPVRFLNCVLVDSVVALRSLETQRLATRENRALAFDACDVRGTACGEEDFVNLDELGKPLRLEY